MPFNGATPACKRACLFRDRFTGGRELIRSPSGFPFSPGLKLRFPSNRAFPVPAPEKLQEKTEGFLSCAERAVPRIFLFLGMEVSPEFEKLLKDGLRDVFSIRPACLFFYSFPMAGACPGKNPVSRILIAGKCSSQPLPEPCIAAYWEAGRAQIRKRERKNSRGSLNSKGKFVQGETRFFHP